MSDDDLIRRMDAVQACQAGPSDEWSKSTRDGYNQAATDCAMNMLRVPAVQPDDRIEALTAERDEAVNQLDSAIHSQIVLEKRTAAVMEDRKLIIEERDRTFALMLARAERAEADNARLRAALIEERTETLWAAYNTGHEQDGRWRHMCMSDGEWLERECGLDNSQPDHPADAVKAAIPLAAERFVAALNTGKEPSHD